MTRSPVKTGLISLAGVALGRVAVRGAAFPHLDALPDAAAGRAILALGGLERFAAVTDSDYDPIRTMAEAAKGVANFA